MTVYRWFGLVLIVFSLARFLAPAFSYTFPPIFDTFEKNPVVYVGLLIIGFIFMMLGHPRKKW